MELSLNITNYLLNNTNICPEINIDQATEYINATFEVHTGCKLYNKNDIINDIMTNTNNDLTNIMINHIKANYISEISYNNLFDKYNLSLIFRNDDIIILHNNKKIILDDFKEIVMNDYQLPICPKLYTDNIMTIINKFINKDITVKYNCINIPLPYLNLFEIKCKKINEHQDISYYENIINKKQTTKIEIKNNYNLSIDMIHRTEVMEYLDDETAINDFLCDLSIIDDIIHNNDNKDSCIIADIKQVLKMISNIEIIIVKFYFVNWLLKICIQHIDLLINNTNLKEIMLNKNEYIKEKLHIIQSCGLSLVDDIEINCQTMQKLLN